MAAEEAARRYAKALFELAREAERADETHAELRALCALLDANAELRSVLQEPLHPAAERRKVLDAVAAQAGAGALLRNFCAFLIEQRRLVDLAGIAREYLRLADAAQGRAKALVRSASPLSAKQQARLQRALSARCGSEVTLEIVLDETLLGGVIAQVGDRVMDGSLRGQLERLRRSLQQ